MDTPKRWRSDGVGDVTTEEKPGRCKIERRNIRRKFIYRNIYREIYIYIERETQGSATHACLVIEVKYSPTTEHKLVYGLWEMSRGEALAQSSSASQSPHTHTHTGIHSRHRRKIALITGDCIFLVHFTEIEDGRMYTRVCTGAGRGWRQICNIQRNPVHPLVAPPARDWKDSNQSDLQYQPTEKRRVNRQTDSTDSDRQFSFTALFSLWCRGRVYMRT